MSVTALTAVFDLDPSLVTPTERLVLLALAWHADEHGRNAWPAISTLARKTSLSRRGVATVLPALKEKGLVHVQSKAARGTVRYAVSLRLNGAATAPTEELVTANDAPRQDFDLAPRAHKGTRHHVHTRSDERPGTTCTPPMHDVHYPVHHVHTIRPLNVLERREERAGCSEAASPPKLNGNGNGHGTNEQQPSLDAPSPADPLELIARESFATLGLYASTAEVQVDFVTRARLLNVPIDDDFNVPLYLWNFKQALKQARRQVQ
jgi:hypothetical protein